MLKGLAALQYVFMALGFPQIDSCEDINDI